MRLIEVDTEVLARLICLDNFVLMQQRAHLRKVKTFFFCLGVRKLQGVLEPMDLFKFVCNALNLFKNLKVRWCECLHRIGQLIDIVWVLRKVGWIRHIIAGTTIRLDADSIYYWLCICPRKAIGAFPLCRFGRYLNSGEIIAVYLVYHW